MSARHPRLSIKLYWLRSLLLGFAFFLLVPTIGFIIFGMMVILYASSAQGITATLLGTILCFILGLLYFVFVVKLADVLAKHHQTYTDLKALSLYNDIRAGIRRHFCVFLRPFYITGNLYTTELVSGGSQPVPSNFEFEGQLERAAKRIGPVLAIGKPGEQVGVGRLLASEEQWRKVAGELIDEAICIFCVPSSRSGTLWEIDYLVSRNHLHKTIFLMPPMPPQGAGGRLGDIFQWMTSLGRLNEQEVVDDWAELVVDMRRRGFDFPQYNREGLLFCAGSSIAGLRCERINLSSHRSIRKGVEKLLSSRSAR